MKLQLLALLLVVGSITKAQSSSIQIHAPFKGYYTCSEHWAGQLKHLGDALGTDCMLSDWVETDNKQFMSNYKNSGLKNTDWFGYDKDVLAPCNCEVLMVYRNPKENSVGQMHPGRASSVLFSTPNGEKVLVAHLKQIHVKKGQHVKAGQVVGTVGNNGYSRAPHIHLGAWSQQGPLQIQFDQATINLYGRDSL